MPDKHPYANANNALTQLFDQLKKSFNSQVDADYLKKIGLAPKNESYIINTIRFLGIIDEQNNGTDAAINTFTMHDEHDFQESFAEIVKRAYKALFDIFNDAAWNLPDGKLVTYFRQSDKSSQLVGTRQAATFRALASYAGKAGQQAAQVKQNNGIRASRNKKTSKPAVKPVAAIVNPEAVSTVAAPTHQVKDSRVALTVRIEVNLPAGGDQETYDKIFKSIRENLMNG